MTEMDITDSAAWTPYLLSTLSVVVWRSAQLLLGIGTVALAGLYYKQDSLLYFPEIGNMPRDPAQNPRGYRSPADHQIPFEDLRIICEDGVSLHAWLMFGERKTADNSSSSSSIPTIIFFHANAGNLGFRLPNAVQMMRRLQVNILMVEYRGYGRSDEVTPSESGLTLDGQTALRFVQNHPKIDPTNIFLFGRSLGGAVTFATAQYAQENSNGSKDGTSNTYIHPLKGVIVENTFTSIPDMVDALMPLVAKFKSLILAIRWNSLAIVPTLTCPILYLAGSRDEIVPHSQMLKLHQSAVRSALNQLHVIHRGTHNESWSQGGEMYWDAITSFLAGAISVGAKNNNNNVHSAEAITVATVKTTTTTSYAAASDVGDASKKEL